MGKIDVPVTAPPQAAPQPSKPEGFSIDKAKIMAMSSESVPLIDKTSDIAVEQMQLKRFLGLDPMDEEYTKDVKGILEWAKEQNLPDKVLFDKIREIKYKLGSHSDTSLARQVYHYLKIDTEIKSLVQKQRMMEV